MKINQSPIDLLKYWMKRPENWVNLITLLVTVYLGYRSLTSGDVNSYLQAVLIVLGLLAFGQLVVSYSSTLRDHDIEELSDRIDALGRGKVSAQSFFITRSALTPWEIHLQGAKRLDVLGASLTTLGITNSGLLKKIKDSGVQVRLIVTNPDNQQLQESLAVKLIEVHSGIQHANLVRNVLTSLAPITGRNKIGGSVEVRVSDYPPSFGYVGVNTDTLRGNISVEIYLNKEPLGNFPVFRLDGNTDGEWYILFRNQFDFLWAHSRAVNFEALKESNHD